MGLLSNEPMKKFQNGLDFGVQKYCCDVYMPNMCSIQFQFLYHLVSNLYLLSPPAQEDMILSLPNIISDRVVSNAGQEQSHVLRSLH